MTTSCSARCTSPLTSPRLSSATRSELDKTTLMSQLDRLEKAGLVIRKIDPRDRRARIPQITQAGEAIRVDVASGTELAETTALAGFSTDEVSMFRRMLFRIIGETRDPGSCL